MRLINKLSILITISTIFQVICAEKDVVPLFLIDSDGVLKNVESGSNPFSKMCGNDFADLIHDIIKLSEVQILFIEDKFCVEDISLKDGMGCPFHHLHQGLLEKKVKYFAGVKSPYKVLNQIFHPQQDNVFYLSNTSTKLHVFDKHKYLYVFFQDGANETRAEVLRRHDLIIREVFVAVRGIASGPVVAFYTGRRNPAMVKKLALTSKTPATVAKPGGSVLISTEGGMYRFTGVYAISPTRRQEFPQVPRLSTEGWTPTVLATKLSYANFELQFHFSMKADKWWLRSVSIMEENVAVGQTTTPAMAPWNSSYICSEPLIILNTRDGSSLVISKYQIQPTWMKERGWRNFTEKAKKVGRTANDFDDAVDCNPYFSSHILAGLFVTGILLGILLYGVVSLFSCNTNDRFDDPTGKLLMADVK